MLAKRYRLSRPSDFKRVYSEGHSWADRLLVLYWAPNGLPTSRFGFSVSRRVGGAVVRNRTKRLMREAVRGFIDLVPPGRDVVLIARQGIAGCGYKEVVSSVGSLFRRAQLFQDGNERDP